MADEARKRAGAYYTPDDAVASLVRWVARSANDRMLDPSCGDGRFLARHRNSAGVEQDPAAAQAAMERAPWAMIHEGNFFRWAGQTKERFDCAAGNPPFIRYQRFNGDVRASALELCARLGARFSSLTSSWAPFLVATASLLRPGGRMAFVVPAEIGHAPYAVPLLEYLTTHFDLVQVVAIRRKIFRELSEDCWLLYAEGFGRTSTAIKLTPVESFGYTALPPDHGELVTLKDWRVWNCRLRPFLMPAPTRQLYRTVADSPGVMRLGEIARVGIGYVTGANEFFHLRPSLAQELGIPDRFLYPTVRNGRQLTAAAVTAAHVERWLRADEPVLLLRLRKDERLSSAVKKYLDGPLGRCARTGYKCRNRDPWYVVPDVSVPDGFLSYMSGSVSTLVANRAGCACTNSVHAVHLRCKMSMRRLQRLWNHCLTALSCEVEGHPLGGGMLKLEPREAARLLLVNRGASELDEETIAVGIAEMKRWRHCGEAA